MLPEYQQADTAIKQENMVFIPGGKFLMGSDKFYPEEKPVRKVMVDPFYMDKYEVTNAAYKKFVDETGYVTVAERPLKPEDYPDAQPELLVPGALVFQKAKSPVDLKSYFNWWAWVPGTNWKHPKGPGSTLMDWKIIRWFTLLMKMRKRMQHGQAKSCPLKRNGNLQQGADWMEKTLPGVMRMCS